MAQGSKNGRGRRFQTPLARLRGGGGDAGRAGEVAEIPPVSNPVEVDRLQGRIWARLGFFILVGTVTGVVLGLAIGISLEHSGYAVASLAPEILPWLPGPFAVVLAIHVRMWAAGKDAAEADDPATRNLGHARVLFLEALLLGVGLGVLVLSSALATLAVLSQVELVASVQVFTAAILLAGLSADIGAEPTRDAQARDEHRTERRLVRLRRAARLWGGEYPTARPRGVDTAGYVAALATAAWVVGAAAAVGHHVKVGGVPTVEEMGLMWLWSLCLTVLACGGWYAMYAALVDRLLGPAVVIAILSAATWILVIAVPAVGLVTVSPEEPVLTAMAVSAAALPFFLPWKGRACPVEARWRSVPARYIGAWASKLAARSAAAREGRADTRRRRLQRWYDTISGV